MGPMSISQPKRPSPSLAQSLQGAGELKHRLSPFGLRLLPRRERHVRRRVDAINSGDEDSGVLCAEESRTVERVLRELAGVLRWKGSSVNRTSGGSPGRGWIVKALNEQIGLPVETQECMYVSEL